jgi:hypothetical protein
VDVKWLVESVAIAIVLLAIGCRREARPPDRPKGVPGTAVWAGGSDGGSWFECRAAAGRSANFCTVYNDHTGEISAEGYFVLGDGRGAATADQLVFEAFDGKDIYLKDNRVLKPAGEPSQSDPSRDSDSGPE